MMTRSQNSLTPKSINDLNFPHTLDEALRIQRRSATIRRTALKLLGETIATNAAYCLLLIAYCLLLIAYCLLFIVYCLLRIRRDSKSSITQVIRSIPQRLRPIPQRLRPIPQRVLHMVPHHQDPGEH
jgi:hypothetical protein